MALITCPECNGQVSDKATVCPHCGYPIAANTPQEKYAFCVKSQPIPTSTVQAWERFTALRLTMEIAGVSTGDAEKMLSTPGSILKDKLTEQEAAAVVLNYQRLHIPTAVEQSNYTLREVEQEKQEAQEAFLKKRAAENPDEFFVFKKVWPGMVDLACTMCGQNFSTDIKNVSVANDLVITAKRPITCTKCQRTASPGTKIAKNVGFFTRKAPLLTHRQNKSDFSTRTLWKKRRRHVSAVPSAAVPTSSLSKKVSASAVQSSAGSSPVAPVWWLEVSVLMTLCVSAPTAATDGRNKQNPVRHQPCGGCLLQRNIHFTEAAIAAGNATAKITGIKHPDCPPPIGTKQLLWFPLLLYVQYSFLAHILHVCCPRFAGFARFLNPNENGLYIKNPTFH